MPFLSHRTGWANTGKPTNGRVTGTNARTVQVNAVDYRYPR